MEPMTAAGACAHRQRRTRRTLTVLLAVLAPLGCGDDGVAPLPACAAAPRLVPGQAVTTTFAPGDPRRGGAPIHYYAVLPAGEASVRISMTSGTVDPFLLLLDGGGQVIAQAFDPVPAQFQRAVLERRLEPGCHLLAATTWSRGLTGPYSLLLEVATPD
jgi:hypothetical protein